MSKLYERVRQARKLTGLTQEELSLDLGLTRSAVAQWEMVRGTAPSVENMVALARRSGMGFEYLATGRGPMHVSSPIPMLTEQKNVYDLRKALSEQQRLLLERFDALGPRQQAGLLALLDTSNQQRKPPR